MQKYELLLVLPGTLDEKEAEIRSNEILNLLKDKDASAEMEEMGKNRLAYPIKQIRYGYFYVLYFEVGSDDLKYIQGQLELQRDLLRAIISKFNAKPQANQKIRYSAGLMSSEDGEEQENVEAVKEEVEVEIPKSHKRETKKVDMKEISKKLDEILDSDDISSQI